METTLPPRLICADDEAVAGMIVSGLLERYPRVKIVLGESGLGWIPYVLEGLDMEASAT